MDHEQHPAALASVYCSVCFPGICCFEFRIFPPCTHGIYGFELCGLQYKRVVRRRSHPLPGTESSAVPPLLMCALIGKCPRKTNILLLLPLTPALRCISLAAISPGSHRTLRQVPTASHKSLPPMALSLEYSPCRTIPLLRLYPMFDRPAPAAFTTGLPFHFDTIVVHIRIFVKPKSLFLIGYFYSYSESFFRYPV